MEFTTFAKLEYQRPDFRAIKKSIKQIVKEMKKAKSFEEYEAAFDKAQNILIDVFTANSLCSIRNTMDKTDKFYDEEMQYLNKQGATLTLSSLALYKTLVKSPYRKQFDEKYGDFLTKKIEYQLKLTSPLTLLDGIKEGKLEQQYSKDAAMCVTEFRGEQCNFYGLLKHMESTDRTERKEAFEAWAALYQSVSDKLDATYDQLVALRCKIARKLKFKNYVEFNYLSNSHFDYTPSDVAKFRKNVQEVIVPFCNELYSKQKERLGIEKLHFYDESLIFPEGNAIPIGTKDELVAKAQQMYHELSKETGEYFDFMVEHDLFDLETRPGKHLGGYCTFLPSYLAPFIFSNFNGTSADVDVLTHEAGHAFQAYISSRCQKTMLSISSTSDINEIHSMAMEHFCYPWMESFFEENANKYRYSHLCSSLCSIPYLVSVDEFQHEVFANPKMSAKERRAVWHNIEKKYLPWRDYDGNSFLEEGGFWMQKQHIFLYPFYYVDYALAQVCAYQFFIRAQKDKEQAWNDYLDLCKRGGSVGYLDLLKSAGLANPFERETMEETVKEIKNIIKQFEEKL